MKLALTAASAAALVFAASAHAQSLADPGFEGTLDFDQADFTDGWEGFFGTFSDPAGSPFSQFGTTDVFEGLQALEVGVDTDASFGGAFTQVNGFTAGDTVEFSVYAKTPDANALTAETQIRIEFFDVNGFISQTGNLTPTLTETYTQFTQTGVVPDGADRARFVLALDSGGDFRGDNGIVFFDDASLTVTPIPEPTSIAALSLSGLLLLRRRR